MRPVRPLDSLECLRRDIEWGRDALHEPRRLPRAAESPETNFVAADPAHQVSQQGSRQPGRREVATVMADDSCQRTQVPFADRHRSVIMPPRPTVLRSLRFGYPQNAGWRALRGPAHTGT